MGDVTKERIDKFIAYFYKDEKGGIDLKSFLKIFEKYESRIDMEEDPSLVRQRRRRGKVERRILEMKQAVFRAVNDAM
jgi:hypothetical protein